MGHANHLPGAASPREAIMKIAGNTGVSPTAAMFRAHEGRLPAAGGASCWMCGFPCPEGSAEASGVIRATFSDADRLTKGGGAQVACEACEWYYDFKILRDGGKRGMGLYTKSVIVWPDRWEEWERETMADLLIEMQERGAPEDVMLCLNFSKQQHVVPWARTVPAGSRSIVVSLDRGAYVRIPLRTRFLAGCVAELWRRGHPKTLIAQAKPAPAVIRKAADPAGDMLLLAQLTRWVGSREMDVLTYIVTEDNRDRLAGGCHPLLRDSGREPEGGGVVGVARESGCRPQLQEQVSDAVVGHPGGVGQTGGEDVGGPHGMEQLGLWQAAGQDRAQ